MENVWALVTGATSGIGLECAKLLLKRGYDVILVGRDLEKLERVKERLKMHLTEGRAVVFMKTDLSEPGAAEEIILTCRKKAYHVEVLVQCAGVGEYDEFLEHEERKLEEMVMVNTLIATKLARHFGRLMTKREKGYMLFVSSIAGLAPVPHWSVYAATKAYVLSLSQALYKELSGSGVSVTCLVPGATETRFWEKAGKADFAERFFPKWLRSSPKEVARAGVRGMFKGRRLVVPGWGNKLMVFLSRFLPTVFILQMLERRRKRVE